MIRTGASCGADCAVVLVFLLPLAGGVWVVCSRGVVCESVGCSGGDRFA